MIKIEVGEKLTLFNEIDKFKNRSGGLLEMTEDGDPVFTLFLPNITEEEIEIIGSNNMKFKLLEENNMIIIYLKFVGTPLIFEFFFNPDKYSDNRMQKYINQDKGLLLNLFAVDSKKNMIVENIRIFNLPYSLEEKLKESWQTDYSNYELFCSKTTKYHVTDNFEKAKYAGKV
jgi:hypothetical protein